MKKIFLGILTGLSFSALAQTHHHSAAESHAGHDKTMAMPLTDNAPMLGSGTAWQPASTPHSGYDFRLGDWQGMVHGSITSVLQHDKAGPKNSGNSSFTLSDVMVRAQNGGWIVTGMFSGDPLGGKSGYPMLFQTGETADGKTTLVDRQHPHNAVMELSARYTHRFNEQNTVFLYAAPVGEPALGPTAPMHRFSSYFNPTMTLSHHNLDSTHISNGVVTAGYQWNNMVQLEASQFRGQESNQYRYQIQTSRLDSSSWRISVNPSKNLSAQISQGRIRNPEPLEPGIDVVRKTASLTYNQPLTNGNWQTLVAFGRNEYTDRRINNAFLIESALQYRNSIPFMRYEKVDRHELFANDHESALHDQRFTVQKATIGYFHQFITKDNLRFGVGASASTYIAPATLTPYYGSSPKTYQLFTRLQF